MLYLLSKSISLSPAISFSSTVNSNRWSIKLYSLPCEPSAFVWYLVLNASGISFFRSAIVAIKASNFSGLSNGCVKSSPIPARRAASLVSTSDAIYLRSLLRLSSVNFSVVSTPALREAAGSITNLPSFVLVDITLLVLFSKLRIRSSAIS